MQTQSTASTKPKVGPKINRRSTHRRPPKVQTKIQCRRSPFGFGPNIATQLLDLAEHGARLTTTESLEVGKSVEITLMSSAGLRLKLEAAVHRVTPSDDGTFTVGVRFRKILPYVRFVELTLGAAT